MQQLAVKTVEPTDEEVTFADNEIIVSKTDLKGQMTYVNRVFMAVSGYVEGELLGQPHNMIRHPDMPRTVFKYLWDTIGGGQEIFAYVKNMTKSGGYYWVFAHVTPTFGANGEIVGYHSNRRTPDRAALKKIEPLYKTLLEEENRHANSKDGLAAAVGLLEETLRAESLAYDEFIFSLSTVCE